MTAKTFKDLFRKAKERDEYWVANAILAYTEDLYRLAEKNDVSQADLARSLGVSSAYIAKVFRGNTNFTIGTMVKLARAAGGRVNIHVSSEGAEVRWLDLIHAEPSIRGAAVTRPLSRVDVSRVGNIPFSTPTLLGRDEDHDYAIAS